MTFLKEEKREKRRKKKIHFQVVSVKIYVDIAIRIKVISQKESKYYDFEKTAASGGANIFWLKIY